MSNVERRHHPLRPQHGTRIVSAPKPSTNTSSLKKTTLVKSSAAHLQDGGSVEALATITKTTGTLTIHELIVTLLLNHPVPFSLKAPKPLAIGIHKEIFERYPQQYTRNVIRLALHKWARRRRYVAVLIPNAVRYTLDGKPAGKVEVASAER